MGEISFGEILRQTRERKGLDLNATARRLRIRPDILRAIEDSNFAAMLRRGYTRNMGDSYARYLGLNPTEITGMYIEELYAYQSGISRSRRRSSGIDMSAADEAGRTHRASRHDAPAPRPRAERSRDAHRSRGGAPVDELSSMKSSRGVRGHTGRVYPDSKTQRSSGSLLPRLNEGTGYANPGDGWRSKLPFIIAAAVVLVIVIIVCSFIFSGTGKSNEDQVANLPVTGLDDSSSSSDASGDDSSSSTSSSSSDVAPTEATFEYAVADGAKPYIEIYVDGTTEVAKDLTGPTSGSYTFTDKVKFVCADADGVTVKINGEEQELKTNKKGIVNNTYTFSDVLNAWNEAHGIATSSSSSSDSSAASSEASSSSSSKSSSASSSSSSKSSKSTSSSSSSKSSMSSSSND